MQHRVVGGSPHLSSNSGNSSAAGQKRIVKNSFNAVEDRRKSAAIGMIGSMGSLALSSGLKNKVQGSSSKGRKPPAEITKLHPH